MTTTTRNHRQPRNRERGPDHDHERGQPGRERRTDIERLHDTPDENGEPPSVRQPGGDPDAKEPPVENF